LRLYETPNLGVHQTGSSSEMSITRIGVGDQLMKWVIPHGFASEAAIVMNDKYPFSRGRIIASLASEEN
uniref:hypothetical protein n=1 Tax=uncultured Bradyrhizobium sp. TaxID=199684 RepID=UPI0035CB68E8